MKLDIIVPHYNEPWETCSYLFNSIALQRGISFDDIRVILVNDGDFCVFGADTFDGYPYRINYYVKEHGGVSAARNYGLDHSDADYVMFCDADDGFLNNYGLHLLFGAMQEGFDFLMSNFVEETHDTAGNPIIVNHDKDLTFMHGKAYNRQFLVDHEIRFDPALTIHEDGYFNNVAFLVAKNEGRTKYVTTPFYLWCWNDNSVVRSNKSDFVLKTYDHVMSARIATCADIGRRGYLEEYEANVLMTVLNSYYDFQKPAWTDPKNRKLYAQAEKEFKRFFDRFKKVFYNATNMKVAQYAQTARQTAYECGMWMENTDLRSWIRHIEYEVKA